MVRVTGHRGARLLRPENTLAGFELAIELGCEETETDVRLTRDGHLVLMHDDQVERTTNGTGAVADLTLAEIQALDAGEGQRVPTFEELLKLVAGRIELLCELKGAGTPAPAVAAVRAAGIEAQVIFTCFDFRHLREVRSLGDELRIGGITSKPTIEQLDELLQLGAYSVCVEHRALTPEYCRLAQQRGLRVRGWNPNTAEAIRETVAKGCDSVSSDNPELAIQVVRGA